MKNPPSPKSKTESTPKSKPKTKSPQTVKTNTPLRVGKFAIIGIILALFNFAIYTFLARVIFNSDDASSDQKDLLWLDSIISYTLAAILAYILHSKVTWKERPVTKHGIVMFFLWNGITALAISPLLTWLFGLIAPIYEFAYQIFNNLHIPFDYDFVESTGIFCLTTLVTMILNYLFYDKLVFGDSETAPKYTYTAALAKSKVSIIVPIYNTAKYLPACLDSILAQTHESLEIILIDDGSTDNSPKIIKDYAKKDPRIKHIRQKNQGQSAARNTGLQKATGDYISFIDADDKIKPDFIEHLLAPFSDNATTLSVCGIHYKRLRQKTAEDVYINPLRPRRKRETRKAYALYLLAIDGRMYSSVNKLYHASIAQKLTFDTSLNFSEDTNFVLDYLKKSKGDPAFVLEPLYIYNFGTATSTINSTATDWGNWQTAYRHLQKWLGSHPTTREKFWLHLVHLRWRISYLRSKRRAKQ